jgi:hypothetical protein
MDHTLHGLCLYDELVYMNMAAKVQWLCYQVRHQGQHGNDFLTSLRTSTRVFLPRAVSHTNSNLLQSDPLQCIVRQC